MSAPASRVQIFYNYNARGFSEILYNTNPVSQIMNPNGNAPGQKIDNYLAKRLPLLNNACVVVYARASVIGVPRVFQIRSFLGQGRVGTSPGNGSPPDDVVLCRMFGSGGASGVMHLHAFPASILKDVSLTNLGAWGGLLTDFGNYMTSGGDGWCINSSVSGLTGARTYYEIGAATPGLSRGFGISPPVAGPLWPVIPPGSVISISGMGNNQVGYNGRKIVVIGANNNIVVGGAIPVGTPVGSGGRFFVVPSNANNINQFIPFELSERKTGKVFGVPAGRRRNTLSLRR